MNPLYIKATLKRKVLFRFKLTTGEQLCQTIPLLDCWAWREVGYLRLPNSKGKRKHVNYSSYLRDEEFFENTVNVWRFFPLGWLESINEQAWIMNASGRQSYHSILFTEEPNIIRFRCNIIEPSTIKATIVIHALLPSPLKVPKSYRLGDTCTLRILSLNFSSLMMVRRGKRHVWFVALKSNRWRSCLVSNKKIQGGQHMGTVPFEKAAISQ